MTIRITDIPFVRRRRYNQLAAAFWTCIVMDLGVAVALAANMVLPEPVVYTPVIAVSVFIVRCIAALLQNALQKQYWRTNEFAVRRSTVAASWIVLFGLFGVGGITLACVHVAVTMSVADLYTAQCFAILYYAAVFLGNYWFCCRVWDRR